MKKRKREKNFIRNRSGGMKQKLPGRLLSLMCALVLVLSTVFLDLGHISAYAFGDELYLETEAEETAEAGAEAQAADLGDDESQINTELSEDISEDPAEVSAEEAEDASEADFSSGDNLDEQELTTEEPEISDDSAAETITYSQLINNDTVEVRAEAPAGALPEGTELVVKEIKNNTDDAEMTEQYNRLSARITEQLQNQGKNLDGFLPYNISFTDMDGNPVKPSEKVTYSFRYTEAAAPELTDPSASTLTAAQLKENKETAQLDLIELKAEENKLSLETNESRQLQKAAFQAADNAVYTFIWSSTPAADNNGEANNEETQEPESEPTQIGTIRLLVDEVNLRTAPSIEADVIGTADAGTELPLLEIITAEDDSTWYKVSYSDTVVYVSSEVAEVVEEEETPAEEAPAEITRYVYESDEVNVKVTLTNPEDLPDDAELSVTPVELSQEAEEQITQEAIKEKRAIEKIRAYDIKFLVNGEEIQPGASVKVEVSFPGEESIEDANVYHVDDKEKVQNMDGSVNKEGNVEFETTHFSTYVIVNTNKNKTVQVTLQHYDIDTNEKIYADTVKEISVGGKIPDYRATENYTVEKVATVENNKEEEIKNVKEIKVAKDTVIRIYYKAKETTFITEEGAMALYDYQINPGGDSKSINDDSHYEKNNKNNRMIMGTQEQANLKDHNAYGTNYYSSDGRYNYYNANIYNKYNITEGLVTGLSSDYKTVEWKVDQPGFFTDNHLGPKEGKQKYTDYKLNFKKNGSQYTLTGVTRPDNTVVNAGSDFYPLGNEKVGDNDNKSGGYYFGIRYDIVFQLGDYIGPLSYNFTGDDDLWVLLDGKVVIDVGGIHNAVSKSTDLWKDLGFKNGARPTTDAQKNARHRITVLYMERGAGESNCQMSFTIPDIRFVNVNNVPLADITLHKVNSSKTVGLQGAKFRLTNDDNVTETYPVMTSDASGSVTFNNLKVGNYTLTEIMAPDGYVSSKETYKVKVTLNGTTTTAKLYEADGSEVEGNKIINYTEKEEAEKNLTSSKTAKVVDYQNRIYQIDLNAATTGREAGVEAKGASVVLVLDASGSMDNYIGNSNTKKIDALQTAAKSFINTLSNRSKESEVSIIWYSGHEGNSESSLVTKCDFTQLSSEGVRKLEDKIENPGRSITGGTPMGVALKTANEQLKSANHPKNKYVVFMTDGMPGYNSGETSWNCQVANNAVNNAAVIKNDAVLYTVGVGLTKDTFKWTKGHSATSSSDHGRHYSSSSMTGEKFLSDYIATSGSGDKQYAYTADNLSDLVNAFDVIAGRIGDLFTVQPERIEDVIDARFKLTKESEDKLKALNNSDKTGYVDIKENADGTTTITWTGNAAKIGNAEAEKEEDRGWSSSFQIQARDDFIGGNMIPTNGASSGIYLEGGVTKEFEQPSVNVKLLGLNIGDKETTVFKGDPINPQNLVNELAGTVDVVELDNTTKTLTAVTPLEGNKVKLPTLTADQIKSLNDNKGLTIGSDQTYKYTYPGSSEEVGYFTYTYTLVKGKAEEHTANEAGTTVEQYNLTVTYHPYSLDERKGKLTRVQEPADNGGTVVNADLNKEGTYKVNVVAGEIQIVKHLDVPAEQDKTFTFKVTRKDVNGFTPVEVSIIVKSGATTGTLSSEDLNKLKALPRGTYEVTEDDANGYTIQGVVAADKTNCYSTVADDKVSFTMGSDNAQKDVITENTYKTAGILGVAAFTNEKVTSDWGIKKVSASNNDLMISGAVFKLAPSASDSSLPTYYGKSQDNGTVKWYSDSNCETEINETIKKGSYTLSELTAPIGYMRSTETWSIQIASKGALKLIQSGGQEIAREKVKTETVNGKEIVYYLYENEVVYDLPSTGGSGIYRYMIGGMLLMVTSAWILYKNKCKEVLEK